MGIREVTKAMDGKIKSNLSSPSLGFDFCPPKKALEFAPGSPTLLFCIKRPCAKQIWPSVKQSNKTYKSRQKQQNLKKQKNKT